MSAVEFEAKRYAAPSNRWQRRSVRLDESESKSVGDDVSRPPVSHRQKRGFDRRLWQ
jgi:hypothetical protein